MVLTVFAVSKAAPKEKPYKLSDGNGLHLLVQPNGTKLWRLRYRFAGVEKMLALGSFPDTSLADARARRDDARRLLASGTDPSAKRKLDLMAAKTAAQNTFGALATDYLNKLKEEGAAGATLEKNLQTIASVKPNLLPGLTGYLHRHLGEVPLQPPVPTAARLAHRLTCFGVRLSAEFLHQLLGFVLDSLLPHVPYQCRHWCPYTRLYCIATVHRLLHSLSVYRFTLI
jgi:hypothetical protein